jgi:pyruvate kinase
MIGRKDYMRKTKIICTIGPASNNEETLRELMLAGMNVARFNFSHGTPEYHKELMDKFRSVRDRLKLPAAVLLDTKGPEIRLGEFEEGKVKISRGSKFTLTSRDVAGNNKIVKILTKPGLWLQYMTTREPDDSQIEVALTSLKEVLTENKEDDKW